MLNSTRQSRSRRSSESGIPVTGALQKMLSDEQALLLHSRLNSFGQSAPKALTGMRPRKPMHLQPLSPELRKRIRPDAATSARSLRDPTMEQHSSKAILLPRPNYGAIHGTDAPLSRAWGTRRSRAVLRAVPSVPSDHSLSSFSSDYSSHATFQYPRNLGHGLGWL